MKQLFVLLAFFVVIPGVSRAQECGTDILHQKLMKSDPEYAARHIESEKQIYNGVLENTGLNEKGNKAVRIIPIVIHVVHKVGTPVGTNENISDGVIIDYVNKLNDRYAHASKLTFSNPYSGVDLDIRVCLATQDPNGKPTNGIVRHADNANTINNMDNQNTQKAFNWPTTDYMNLYIVNTICDDNSPCPTGNGVAGYAYFPSAHGQPYDGGVFRYSSFWDGLLAHEMGHYFGLYHVFQNSGSCVNNNCLTDGDRVCDTPPKLNCCTGPGVCANTDNTCTTDEDDKSTNNPFRAVSLGGLGDQPESMENYMDFTATCWEAYTEGQKTRMLASIDVNRASLLKSAGCGTVTGVESVGDSPAILNLVIAPNPASQDITVSFSSESAETLQYFVYNMYGQIVVQGMFNTIIGNNTMELDVSKLPESNYILSLDLAGQKVNKRITKVR